MPCNEPRIRLERHDRIDGIEHLDKIIDIDQSPIGRTPRSNPATYVKLFDNIRDLFAELPESKRRGFTPSTFSFNTEAGRCSACDGHGANRLDMEFLADLWVPCAICEGKRYSRPTLQVEFKGKSIADCLDLDVQQALEHFSAFPKIYEKLQTLHDVGLDYLKLGQPSPTLSGGEAQRIKLSRELSRRATGRTLYVLDEPTTGLHFYDIDLLFESVAKPGGPRQYGHRHRAQSGPHSSGRLGHRHGARGWCGRWHKSYAKEPQRRSPSKRNRSPVLP